jgi:subtilisin family serine protease
MVGTNSGFPDSHALNSPKPMTVSLRLSLPSVGQSKGETTQEDILEEQTATIQRIQALLAGDVSESESTATGSQSSTKIQILGQTQLVLNSIFLRFPQGISSEQLHLISTQVDGIKRISPMGHYQVSMLETESHVGAKMAQNLYGYDGTGVRVGVLDTGVDYTHKNLGGPGTVEAYIEAMGVDPYDERNKKRDNLFPTVKVVDGYDFVGELSAGEDDDEYIEFDEDPIDAGGHGTSVADTIAGMNGIAPGADIIALKVCAGQGGCPGLSIAMGIEWAVKNSVDILNLSLGSDYGKCSFWERLTQ